MEQNKNYYTDENSNSDFAKLQEWITLCISKWHWFLMSFLIVGALTVLFILKTPPTYTRSTSILVKDDDASSALSKEFGQFAASAFGKSRMNIQNEMITFISI